LTLSFARRIHAVHARNEFSGTVFDLLIVHSSVARIGEIDPALEVELGSPERELRDRRVCVTGRIQQYQGKPEIVASEPKQIERQ
jgi:hypothetical protein